MCLLASTVGALQLSDDPCGAHARGRCAEDTRRLHLHTIMILHRFGACNWNVGQSVHEYDRVSRMKLERNESVRA